MNGPGAGQPAAPAGKGRTAAARATRAAPARRVWAALAALAVLVGPAACGVPAEPTPREITSPQGRQAGVGSASPTPTEGTGEATEPLCFVREGRLVRVIRRVPNWPTIETQVQHLLAGPTVAERDAGLTNAVTGTMVIASILLAGGRVTVNLGDDVEGSGRSDEVLAFGQLVCTLTARPDIVSVAFTRDGRPLEVPRADGSLARGPLTAADYTSLMPPG